VSGESSVEELLTFLTVSAVLIPPIKEEAMTQRPFVLEESLRLIIIGGETVCCVKRMK
jgi:hypothetical protein